MPQLIWDWNGTLIDDQHLVVESVNVALEAIGADRIDMTAYRRHPKRPVRVFYSSIIDRTIDDADWALIEDVYHANYFRGLDAAPLAPEAVETLDRAQDLGLPQSLLSMWHHEHLLELIEARRLGHYFNRVDGVRGACGGVKRDHLAEHIDALMVSPSDVVMVGDTIDDAIASHEVGITCILVDTLTEERNRLEESDYPVVDSLADALRVACDVFSGASFAHPQRGGS